MKPQSRAAIDLTANLPPGTLRADDPDGTLYEAVCSASWLGFIRFAFGNAEIQEQFTAATGLVLDRKRIPIEAIVDKATDYGDHVADRFVEWITVELYGIEAAPAAYRAEIARRQAERGSR